MNRPEKRIYKAGWIYHYGCGCSAGPLPKSELLEYCGIHGHNLQDKYYIPRKRILEEKKGGD